MTKTEFLELIKDNIAAECEFPIKIKAKQFDSVINRVSNWFYEHWEEAVQPEYVIIPEEKFNTKEFREKRKIKLPKCVRAVDDVQETSSGFFNSPPDDDFDANKFIMGEAYFSPFDSDTLLYRTAQFSFWDLASKYIVKEVRFQYNNNTNDLVIIGRDPDEALVMKAYVDIPLESLYEDEKFQRYMIGKVKELSGKNLAGYVEMQLIGGASINLSYLVEEGKEEQQNIEQEILNDQQPPSFIVMVT